MSTNNIAGEQLKAFIERIERVEEEIKSSQEDRKEIYVEVKGMGYDVTVLKEIVRRRKEDADARKEHEEILDLYMQALAMVA